MPQEVQIADGVQDTAHAAERLAVAADVDSELARTGALRAAAHRGVEQLDTMFPAGSVHLADERGGVRGQVEPGAARLQRAQQPAVAHAYLPHFGGPGQGREDHVSRVRQLGDRSRPGRPGLLDGGGARAAEVVHDEVVARAAEVERHALAHQAQSDEADPHGCPFVGERPAASPSPSRCLSS